MVSSFDLFSPKSAPRERAQTNADMVGARFGRLVVLREVEKRGAQRYVECACDCGKAKIVCLHNLRRGYVKSCGCLRAENSRARQTKHGHIRNGLGTPTYTAWQRMQMKCHTPSNVSYHLFGAKGVTVCATWRDNFPAFLRDMDECPRGHSLHLKRGAREFNIDTCYWRPRKSAENGTTIDWSA